LRHMHPDQYQPTRWQSAALILLRLSIGWHFLHEGYVKFAVPGWSARGYLASATGPLADMFHWLAGQPLLLAISNQLVRFGIIAVGLGLLLGIFTRLSCLGGMALLAMFYWAQPAWSPDSIFGLGQPGAEGNYFIINKMVIEGLALLVLATFDTGMQVGLDAFLRPIFSRDKAHSRREDHS
jgi:thiosulfate dehydrogenase (quinone) large subunit